MTTVFTKPSLNRHNIPVKRSISDRSHPVFLALLIAGSVVHGSLPADATPTNAPAASSPYVPGQTNRPVEAMTQQVPSDDRSPNFNRVDTILASLETKMVGYQAADKGAVQARIKDLRLDRTSLEKQVLAAQSEGVYKIAWIPHPVFDPLLEPSVRLLSAFLKGEERFSGDFEDSLADLNSEILKLRSSATETSSPSRQILEKRLEELVGARAAMLRDYYWVRLSRIEREAKELEESLKR